jgi:hypothetical protein
MSLAGPAWLAAIAAVVLAVAATVTAIFAIRALGQQNGQLREQQAAHARLADLIELQAEELRDSARERRRAQAAQVFIEVDRIPPVTAAGPVRDEPDPPLRLSARVRNTSSQPIYDLHVIWQAGMVRMGKPDRMGRLMPGCDASFHRRAPAAAPAGQPAGPSADPAILGAFLAFRDAAGMRWAVREDGTLTDIVTPGHDTQITAE